MSQLLSRRETLGLLAASAGARAAVSDPWAALPGVLARIQPPKFPAGKMFVLPMFGARGDGKTDCTEPFRNAIAACVKSGGGTVVVPDGVFLTGPIHLKSGVNLHVTKGATIRFSRNPKDYLPLVYTRWEGMECMNYSSLIYAFEQKDIAVTGEGTLDGGANEEHWWPWKGRRPRGGAATSPTQQKARDLLQEMAEKDVPVEKRKFGEGSYLRPQFIQPYRCQNVLIEGVTIVNSPMWEINPVLCRNVTVKNVKVSTHGPNNDGCNPECSADVLIDGCVFDTGDDCIAIKSGRNRDGRRVNVPSENIVVQNCVMKDGHGGVTLGSECSGGIRNVFARNCRMDSPNLDRILRIKTNAVRGGVIEHVYMKDIDAGQVAGAAVDIDFNYEEGAKGSFQPVVRDIVVTGVRCKQSGSGWALRGFPNSPIRNVRIERSVFEKTGKANVEEHVEGLVLRDVTVNGKKVG
jgi:polygalacturonase